MGTASIRELYGHRSTTCDKRPGTFWPDERKPIVRRESGRMTNSGYYRCPTIHGDNVVFVCEDDLWSVSAQGGVARRLTTASGECSLPRISPDGKSIAYTGRDEWHPEVYVISTTGGPTE